MKPVSEQLYKKIIKLSDSVKSDFRRKGIAIPVKNNDGSITLGNYSIKKKSDSFYYIVDYSGEVIVDKINLPQTAAIIANNLAVGKWIDDHVLTQDRNYGYALFEETLYKKHAENSRKKDPDRMVVMLTKSKINRTKKENCKKDIMHSFVKLLRFT
jgi:hypothetical protein